MSGTIVAAGLLFHCTAVAVWDGDGPIRCTEGVNVRLAGIAARERDGSCRPAQPCPPASGIAARNHLVDLLGAAIGTSRDGHVRIAPILLTCRSRGADAYRRTVAACNRQDGLNVGCTMIRDGFALRWPRYDDGQICSIRRPGRKPRKH